jgi:ABC-type Fe3+/spermidine/putrescine transport system ATPase subunit
MTEAQAALTKSATAEPVLRLIDVSKTFGTVRAVDHVSINVMDGEVLTLLGPSGCGKTTTLRMVIGLERCSEGEIIYQGRVVDSARTRAHVPTHKRSMGMVFQSYAIWPHMTVFENVAYPLRVRGEKSGRVRDEVHRVLELVGLDGLEQRPATMLSGGQQQRVALARSLVFEPKILLLDEPFSNLDAKLREQMRAELRVLQRRLGITVLFVTHDQIEALSLSDRIAVMDHGRVEQIGPPHALYVQPETPVVRDFLGRTIILRGQVKEIGPDGALVATVHDSEIACSATEAGQLSVGQECYVAVRPEQVQVESMWTNQQPASSRNRLRGDIEALLFVGERYEARIVLPWGENILAYLPPISGWRENQSITLILPPDQVRAWPA